MQDRSHERRAKNDPAGSGTHRRPGDAPQGEPPDRGRAPLPTRVDDLPPLPQAYHRALDDGLAVLDLELDGGTRRLIDDHVRLLLAWNPSINLTAIDDPADVAVRHVLDSLTAVSLLRARRIDRLVDLGSGGGFPGLTLAAAVPLRRTLLVESVGKKAGFLEAAARATGLAGGRAGGRAGGSGGGGARSGVEVAAERLETIAARPTDRGRWPAVSARAVGPLADLVELAFPLLQPGGVLIAWKRGEIDAELELGWRAIEGLGGGRLEVLPVEVPQLTGHALVVATRTGQVPAMFPRDPRLRKREPW